MQALLILKLIVGLATKGTAKGLIMPVKDPFPTFLFNHRFFFGSTGYADPFVAVFCFE
jgi:hypothetical protein